MLAGWDSTGTWASHPATAVGLEHDCWYVREDGVEAAEAAPASQAIFSIALSVFEVVAVECELDGGTFRPAWWSRGRQGPSRGGEDGYKNLITLSYRR